MYTIDTFPGRTITHNGKSYLYFGGTAYLGLQTDPEFQALFISNIKKYGTGYSASRKSNVQLSIFQEAETYLANLVGSAACITLSSGYLAGQLICDYFNSSDHQLFYAPNTHSALVRGTQTVFDNWENLFKKITEMKPKDPVLLLDSVDFQGSNYPNYEWLQKLPLDHIILVVDDSHGIGITGKEGQGSFDYLKSLRPKELLVSCSMGKGFGVQAGAIFGNRERLEALKDTRFFGGASPASPASLATILRSHDLYTEKRDLLLQNTELFLNLLSDSSPFVHLKGHPTFSFQNKALADKLEERRILVTNFRYPTEHDELMSRIVINTSHTKGDILKLCTVLNEKIP